MSRQDITILKKKLKKARENEKLRDIYEYSCSLAACLTDAEEYEEALSLYKEGLKASEILNYNEGIALSNRMIAETCMSLGNFDEALKHVNIFLKCAQNGNNKVEEQRGLVLKGHVFFTHAEYLTDAKPEDKEEIANLLNKSMEAYRKSFAICISDLSHINDKERLQMKARLLQNKSIVLIRQNKLDLAQNHLIRAVKICAKEKLKDTECMCYLSLGDLYQRKGEYENAFNVFEKASELSTTAQRKIDAAVAKARTCVLLDNLEKAKIILRKSYKLKPNAEVKKLLKYIVTLIKLESNLCTVPVSDSKSRIQLYKKLGSIYCALNNLKKGIKCYLNMLGYCQKSETFRIDLIKCYKLLCEALKRDQQYDKALFYCNQEVELVRKEPEKACRTYYRMAKLHELNSSDFEEIYYAYVVAKSKAIEFNLVKMKLKCLNQIIRVAKKAQKGEIVENAMKELSELKEAESDSSCDSSSNDESDGTDSNESGEPTSDSDTDIQNILQEFDIENEEIYKSKKRSRRNKFSIKRNEKGETDLHVAAIKGNYRKVKALLDQGHPVNVRDTAGWTPLHEACNHGYVDIVKILLEYGADINDKGGPCCDGTTPLHDAAVNGQLEVINILVEKGASVLVLNKFGETPLQCLMKWKKSSALDGQEEEMLNTLIKVLKSPLDTNNLKSIQLNTDNSTEKIPEVEVKKVKRKMNLPTCNPQPFDKFMKNKRNHGKRQALRSSDEEQSSGNSDTGTDPSRSGACSMYRNVIKNLRHRPKKFKTSENTESESKKALIDAENYVENCIMDNDEDEDDEGDVNYDKGGEDDDSVGSCGVIERKDKKEKSKIDKTQVISQSPPEKTDFSDFEEDFLDQLMKELEEPPSGATGSHLSDGEIAHKSPLESTLGLAVNKYSCTQKTSQDKLLGKIEVSNCNQSKSDVPKDASLNSSGDSDLWSSKTVEAVSDRDVHVKVCNNDVKVTVKTADMHKLNVDWLVRELAKKYPILESNDHFLSLKTATKSFLSETDFLTSIANEVIEITPTKWKLFALSERYEKACSKKNHFDVAPETRYHGFRYTILPQVRDVLKTSSPTRCFALSNLKLSSLTLIPICKALKYESFIQILNFSNNYFGDKGLESIVKVLDTCIVEELDLSGCNITSSGLYHLSDSLNAINELCRNGLQVLNLSKNPITDDAVEALYNILEKLPNLSVLNIEGCELETEIKANDTTTSVILQGSNVGKT